MARKLPPGAPPPPAVQKLRLRYTKLGRLRFTSHRDIARAWFARTPGRLDALGAGGGLMMVGLGATMLASE